MYSKGTDSNAARRSSRSDDRASFVREAVHCSVWPDVDKYFGLRHTRHPLRPSLEFDRTMPLPIRFAVPTLGGLLLCLLSLSAQASLYRDSGMQRHQEHFQQALQLAQQNYLSALPASVRQSLELRSQQRFEPEGMHQRAQTRLALALDRSTEQEAQTFYRSALGRKIVALETRATSPAGVRELQQRTASPAIAPARQALLQRLGERLPVVELGVEAGVAIGSLALQGANDLLGGLLQIPEQSLDGQRQRLRGELQSNLLDSLAQVYASLSDQELRDYLGWAESEAGRQFLAAVELAAREALNP